MSRARIPTRRALVACAALAFAGCATVPTGPMLSALPGSTSTTVQFDADDVGCRGRAQAQFGVATTQQANNAAAANVAGGALFGAAIGALFGAAVGDAGTGAAIGAGMGLLGGSAVAADMSGYSQAQLQRMYDGVYWQCMYDLGHRIPGPPYTYRITQGDSVSQRPPAAPRRFQPPSSVEPPAGYPPRDAPPPAPSRG